MSQVYVTDVAVFVKDAWATIGGEAHNSSAVGIGSSRAQRNQNH